MKKTLAQILQSHVLPNEYYLAGGTGIYLYFRHRLSVDIDFFTISRFTPELFLAKMKEIFDEVIVGLMERDPIILFVSPEQIKLTV